MGDTFYWQDSSPFLSLTGSATVVVKIHDVNDNRPEFIGNSSDFYIPPGKFKIVRKYLQVLMSFISLLIQVSNKETLFSESPSMTLTKETMPGSSSRLAEKMPKTFTSILQTGSSLHLNISNRSQVSTFT